MSYDKRFFVSRIALIILCIACTIFLAFLVITLALNVDIDLNKGEHIALIIFMFVFLLFLVYLFYITCKARFSKIVFYKEGRIVQIYGKILKEYEVDFELIKIIVKTFNDEYIKIRIIFKEKTIIDTITNKKDFYDEIKKVNINYTLID